MPRGVDGVYNLPRSYTTDYNNGVQPSPGRFDEQFQDLADAINAFPLPSTLPRFVDATTAAVDANPGAFKVVSGEVYVRGPTPAWILTGGVHAARTDNPHQVTKAQVGLGNVDNTSDANKPVSTAVQTQLTALQNNITTALQSISESSPVYEARATDIAPAIEAMLAAGQKYIELKPGVYQLPGGYAKTGVNNVKIYSPGGATIVVGANNTGFHLTNCSFWKFENVQITRAAGSTSGDAILFDGNSSSNMVMDCYIAGHKGRGIAFVGTSGTQQSGNDCWNNIIIDCDGGGIHHYYSNDYKIFGNEIGKVSSSVYLAFGVKLEYAHEGQWTMGMTWDCVRDIHLEFCNDVGLIGGRIEEAQQEGIYGNGCVDILISTMRLHTHSKASTTTYDAIKFVGSTGISVVANSFRTWNLTKVNYSVNFDAATAATSRILVNAFKGYNAATPYNVSGSPSCIVHGNDPVDAWMTLGTRDRAGTAVITARTPGAVTDITVDTDNPNTTSFAGQQQNYRVAGATRVAYSQQRAGLGDGGQALTLVRDPSGAVITRSLINQYGHCLPGADNTQDLGSASARYSGVYLGAAPFVTSDLADKQDIAEFSEAEKRVAVKLRGLMRKYRMKDAVAEKGDKARTHAGTIAQWIVEAFESEGLDAFEWGVVGWDPWNAQEEQRDDEGNIIIPAREAGDRFSVRYEELFCMILGAM